VRAKLDSGLETHGATPASLLLEEAGLSGMRVEIHALRGLTITCHCKSNGLAGLRRQLLCTEGTS